MQRHQQNDTSTPIDGSEGGYHDAFPTQSIDQVTEGLAAVKNELSVYGGKAPPMNDPSGRTAAQYWQLHYLETALALSLRKKKVKAGL